MFGKRNAWILCNAPTHRPCQLGQDEGLDFRTLDGKFVLEAIWTRARFVELVDSHVPSRNANMFAGSGSSTTSFFVDGMNPQWGIFWGCNAASKSGSGSSHVPKVWWFLSYSLILKHQVTTRSLYITLFILAALAKQCLRRSCMVHAVISGSCHTCHTCPKSKWSSLRLEGHFPLVATMIWSSDIASCQASRGLSGVLAGNPLLLVGQYKMVADLTPGPLASRANHMHFTPRLRTHQSPASTQSLQHGYESRPWCLDSTLK